MDDEFRTRIAFCFGISLVSMCGPRELVMGQVIRYTQCTKPIVNTWNLHVEGTEVGCEIWPTAYSIWEDALLERSVACIKFVFRDIV